MFTGIIETLGTLHEVKKEGTNLHFTIESELAPALKIDQSVAHNGVCLTVVATDHQHLHTVTAIAETLRKTHLKNWQVGDKINLERCMLADGRLDGHIVQGHVDQLGTCTKVTSEDGSWLYDFTFDPASGNYTVEKGSICVNGVSLTVVNSQPTGFSVAIIPYTYEHTNFHQIEVGTQINIEFDIIGKYIQRLTKGYV
ncbi:MAG: riboflavin synthase [Thermonemataceae bacterium]